MHLTIYRKFSIIVVWNNSKYVSINLVLCLTFSLLTLAWFLPILFPFDLYLIPTIQNLSFSLKNLFYRKKTEFCIGVLNRTKIHFIE